MIFCTLANIRTSQFLLQPISRPLYFEIITNISRVERAWEMCRFYIFYEIFWVFTTRPIFRYANSFLTDINFYRLYLMKKIFHTVKKIVRFLLPLYCDNNDFNWCFHVPFLFRTPFLLILNSDSLFSSYRAHYCVLHAING